MSVATVGWDGAGSAGANSCQITYAASDILFDSVTINNFPADSVSLALKTFLEERGWTFIANTHTTGGGTAGRYAFSAPNLLDSVGAASTKYIFLDFTTSGKLYIKVFETIQVGNVAPVNLAYNSDVLHGTVSAHIAGVTTAAGKMWLGATARHIIMHSFSGGVYGNTTTYVDNGPIGCFETTRPNTLDTVAVGYPKFVHFATGPALSHNAAISVPVTMPRNRIGTGAAATTNIVTAYGAGGVVNGTTVPPHLCMPAYLNTLCAKPNASQITVHSSSSGILMAEVIGTMINCLAVTRSYGLPIGDDIQIPVSPDVNFGNETFFDPNGTLTGYWLLGGLAASQGRIAVPK